MPFEMEANLKRISLLLREEQYKALTERDLNVSGLVRDLIDDYLSEHKVTLGVSEETRGLYDKIVANTGSTDKDIEKYFKDALGAMLKDKILEMQDLQERSFKKKK